MMAPVLFTFLALFFPGVLLFFRGNILPAYSTGEKLILTIPVSLAYWIIGFWWLSIIPVPFTLWVYLSVGAAAFIAGILWIRPAGKPTTISSHVPFIIFMSGILIPQLLLMSGQSVPSGADMSMHTYIASAIIEADKFPRSLTPVIPVGDFGLYPFGFSAVVAVLSAANRLPTYVNALLLTAVVHLLFDFSLYLVLRARFTPLISAIAAVVAGWVSNNPHLFIAWGANPSVLALTFLCLGVALYLANRKPVMPWLTVLFLCASFLTNYMFVVALAYIVLPVFFMSLLRSGKKVIVIKKIVKPMMVLVLISLPFITKAMTAGWHLSEATRKFVKGFHYEETAAWTGSISWKGFTEIAGIIMTVTDKYLLIFFGLLLIFLFRYHKKIAYVSLYVTGILSLLIVNARYWWLPGSAVLYPYRTTLILLIPIAWSMALLFTHLQKKGHVVFIAGLILILGFFLPRFQFSRYREESRNNIQVIRSDLSAMAWLKTHSTKTDVIWNRYEDAGLWIPAIISRPITLYHTNPVDMSTLKNAATPLPTYAFIGAKAPQELPIAEEVAVTFPEALHWEFDIVYHNGNTAIYKITR